MKNKKNRILLGVALLVLMSGFLLFISFADAQASLVNCGRTGTGFDDRCRLCDLIVGIKGIIDWGRSIMVAIALTAIVAGVIMYIVSAGNQQMMESAKNIIKQALIGVVIVLTAWLIVNTSMWLLASKSDLDIGATSWDSFTCEYSNSQASGGGGTTGGGATGGGSAPTAMDEINKRNLLTAAGVGVNNTNCDPGETTGCTTIGGLREETITGVTDLKSACGDDCDVIVTAGSEGGHSTSTDYSHENGYKADLRLNDNLNSYITSNYEQDGTRDGATLYYDKDGNVYAREGNHWDVCYGCAN